MLYTTERLFHLIGRMRNILKTFSTALKRLSRVSGPPKEKIKNILNLAHPLNRIRINYNCGKISFSFLFQIKWSREKLKFNLLFFFSIMAGWKFDSLEKDKENFWLKKKNKFNFFQFEIFQIRREVFLVLWDFSFNLKP